MLHTPFGVDSETNTFHLPVGELTITLDDVSSLLHLPITGALHSFHALSVEETIFLLTELLEVSAEEARAETARSHGAYVRLGWVRDIYEMRCQARRWIVAARAYLLHLVGCTLFANKSAIYVHVVHLDAFRDLGQSGGYAWGVVALVHMYDQLDEASRTTTRQIAGYLTLLQCWIYEHFPSVHQCVTDDAYQETSPRASRWLTSKAHMKGITGAPYRAHCNALTITDVSWLPYTEHRGVSADYMEWFFRISHPFVIPTQAGDQPRDAPAADPEEYMQPPSPQDDYDGYEAIAQRGGASADGSVRARQRRCIDH
ncbi:protein MAIN-LIKE 1-like [Glycine soja]|uniref:protein MAIN-LIKE 1-like n=1 Tax=Glycine soja TaxID=3848 RepID=UPI00103DA40E|nr:protein MAIN-LIKE 1-like [Glycine soja]